MESATTTAAVVPAGITIPEGTQLDWVTVYLVVPTAEEYEALVPQLEAEGWIPDPVGYRFDPYTGKRAHGGHKKTDGYVSYTLEVRKPYVGATRAERQS